MAVSGKIIGLILAVLGNCCIGIALNVQKYAHNFLEAQAILSNEERVPFHKVPTWWIGVIMMVGGEIGNFVAFGFAPATMVSPLGAVSVIVNVFIAHRMLNEEVRQRDILGLIAAIGGATFIVIFAPSKETELSAPEVFEHLLEPTFLVYFVMVLGGIAFFATRGQVYSKKYVFVDVLVCSLLGSITVIATKGLSTFIRLTFQGDSQFKSPIVYIFILVAVMTGVTQVRYLNKAMQNFDASEVVPVYYVFFTMASISAGVVFFQEFYGLSAGQLLAFFFGCCCTFGGIFLITSNRKSVLNMHVPLGSDDEDANAPTGSVVGGSSVYVVSTESKPLVGGTSPMIARNTLSEDGSPGMQSGGSTSLNA